MADTHRWTEIRVVTTRGGDANLGSRERARGLRLHATDVDWTHGAGPEVTGPGESILMALAGRPVAATELAGEGRETLLDRASGRDARTGGRP